MDLQLECVKILHCLYPKRSVSVTRSINHYSWGDLEVYFNVWVSSDEKSETIDGEVHETFPTLVQTYHYCLKLLKDRQASHTINTAVSQAEAIIKGGTA